MVDQMLKTIAEVYPLEEKTTGPFGKIWASGMRFTVRRYYAQGLGSVAVMQAKGFLGLTKMDTLIINPQEVDMPLLSYDRMYAMGNDTLIFEIYNTLKGENALPATAEAKASGAELPEHDPGTHWYDKMKLAVSFAKKGKKTETPAFDDLSERYLQGFLADCTGAAAAEPWCKRLKAAVYVEGLLKHGGPSTDVFIKAIGERKTGNLFRQVLFGTEV